MIGKKLLGIQFFITFNLKRLATGLIGAPLIVLLLFAGPAWGWLIFVPGALLILGQPGGLYWTVPGLAFAILGGILNTWVLLVEILR